MLCRRLDVSLKMNLTVKFGEECTSRRWHEFLSLCSLQPKLVYGGHWQLRGVQPRRASSAWRQLMHSDYLCHAVQLYTGDATKRASFHGKIKKPFRNTPPDSTSTQVHSSPPRMNGQPLRTFTQVPTVALSVH